MNIKTACFLLDISPDELYDPGTGHIDANRLRRQYLIQSLRLHPDKNPAPDAAEQFQRMRDAYLWASSRAPSASSRAPSASSRAPSASSRAPSASARSGPTDIEDDDEDPYTTASTLWSWFQEGCEDRVSQWIDRQDKDTLHRIHEWLSHPVLVQHMARYKQDSVLHILHSLVQSTLQSTLQSKCSRDQTIVLHPSLANIVNDQVFRLVVHNQTYWIPLWVEELVYDQGDHDLIVQCNPVLPSNVVVDDSHLYVYREYSITKDVWGHHTLDVAIDGIEPSFHIPVSKLRITHLPQKILISTHGIPRTNTEKVYDVSRRGSIFALITLIP